MAEQVVRMPAPPVPVEGAIPPGTGIQRKCTACEREEKKNIRRKPQSDGASNGAAETDHAAAGLLPGSGRPLPKSERTFFESRFGHDFSAVRIHTEHDPALAAKSINARAFTVGNHIAFGAGEYNPASADGKKLIAHELTHTLQRTDNAQPQIRRDLEDEEAETETAETGTETEVPAARLDFECRIVRPGDPAFSRSFLGSTVMQYRGNNYLFLDTDHTYAECDNLGRAYNAGLAFFGSLSWAILHKWDESLNTLIFYTVPLSETVTLADLSASPNESDPGSRDMVMSGDVLPNARGDYQVAGLFFEQGSYVVSTDNEATTRLRDMLDVRMQGHDAYVSVGQIRREIFRRIDDLLSEDRDGNLQQVAGLLAELSARAFEALGWERKAEYIAVLVDAWTMQRHERAVIEIIKSAGSLSELEAMFEEVRRGGRYDQLFDDSDYELWNMLEVIGQKFGVTRRISISTLFDIVAGFMSIPTSLDDITDEFYTAADTFMGFIGSVFESLWLLITRPDQLIEGLAGMAKMLWTLQKARMGDSDATAYMAQMLQRIGRKLLDILNGIEIVNQGDELARQIRWTLVWEIASFFIGVGEIKLAIRGASAAFHSAMLLRALRLLGFAEDAADAGRITARISEVARAIGQGSRIVSSEERILELIAYLPEDDLVRLRRAVDAMDADTITQLDQLGDVGRHIRRQVETLEQFANKAGGLSPDVVSAYRHLGRQLSADDLARIIDGLADEDAALFARIVNNGMTENPSFYRVLAGSRRRMEAMIDLGPDTMRQISSITGHNAAKVDELLAALERIRDGFPESTRAADYRRFLEGIRRSEDSALLELEAARAAQFGGESSLRSGIGTQVRINDAIARGDVDSYIRALREEIPPQDSYYVGRAWDYDSFSGPPGRMWRPGDPIDMPDVQGRYPTYDTARGRYWRNRAYYELDARQRGLVVQDPTDSMDPMRMLTDTDLQAIIDTPTSRTRSPQVPQDAPDRIGRAMREVMELEHHGVPQRVRDWLVDIGYSPDEARRLARVSSPESLQEVTPLEHAFLDEMANRFPSRADAAGEHFMYSYLGDLRVDRPLSRMSDAEIRRIVTDLGSRSDLDLSRSSSLRDALQAEIDFRPSLQGLSLP